MRVPVQSTNCSARAPPGRFFLFYYTRKRRQDCFIRIISALRASRFQKFHRCGWCAVPSVQRSTLLSRLRGPQRLLTPQPRISFSAWCLNPSVLGGPRESTRRLALGANTRAPVLTAVTPARAPYEHLHTILDTRRGAQQGLHLQITQPWS